MKTKYLLSALIAGAMGSGAALADTYHSTDSAHDGYTTRSEVKSQANRDMRENGVGTGEGYTRDQLREAGRGGNPVERYEYMTQGELRESQTTGINAGTISIGDGTAYP